jgi:16S rRNA processing protein RimM
MIPETNKIGHSDEDKQPKKSDFDQRVGEIVTFIGLNGTMKIRPSSNNPALFLDIQNVLLKPINKNLKEQPQKDIEATIKDIKLVKNFLQIQFKEYDSRTDVEHLKGFYIFTTKSQVKDLGKNEWWVNDLIGLDVYTTKGKLIGTICDAPGEHGEFLEIKKTNDSSSETVIVSFVKDLFPVVDIKSRRIEVVDLPGLFD